jgi:type VI secretion system secreted protein VgrG
VRSGAELCTSEAQLRDYDARKPGYPLDRRTLAGDASKVEEPLARYSFAVGRFDDDEGGDLLAQRRLEQSRTASRTYQWEVSFPVRAGMRIRLREHPQDDANGDFLVVAARTEVNPARKTRKHIAEVVPASVPWRPEVLPKPRIQGHQTAFVAGAPGKEIDVDAEGRIAVRFHWDTRKEGVSRRVRVATPWMGTNRGFWTLPRVGDEVVVAYLDGDPDQPLVVGSVNNAVAPPAATLPKYETQSWWKSKSTGNGDGYNAILMEDQEGQEALALRAERDFFSETGRRSEVYVGENQIVRVGGSQTVMVGGGQSTGAGNVSLATGGEYKVHSKGDMEISCDGSRSDTTSAFHSIGAQNLTLTGASAALLVGGNVSIVANDGAITLTAGGSSIEVGPAGIKIASNADVAINGAFLKLNC